MRRRFHAFFLMFAVLVLASGTRVAAQDAKKTIRIAVNLREAPKRIIHSRMEIPVAPGPLTLVYPKWIPGEHAPNGPISDLTGLHFRAGEKEITWRRDDADMYAFHLDVPPNTSNLEVSFDYLLPNDTDAQPTGPSATAQLALLSWYTALLYPEGKKSDDLTVAATLTLPRGWKFGTALPVAKQTGEEIEFQPASLTTLVDSPVIAGAFVRTIELSPGQTPNHVIHLAGDSAAATMMSPEQILEFRQLVAETGALFGARHYRRYDFLLTLSDFIRPNGVEHHESSDNRVPERTLLDPDIFESQAALLEHEFFHSWNGKYRRPVGLTPENYQSPLEGELLWVYEGLTEYYGNVLTARDGGWTPERLREFLADRTAYLNQRPGRTWRDLLDTAVAAQLLYPARTEGSAWRRSVDYYDEGTLIWLEADTIIRRESRGKKSLDDFCRSFHGGQATPPKVVTYNFDDIVRAMNEIQTYDWRNFFTERLTSHGPGAPLAGIEASGWRLVFTETMNEHQHSREAANHAIEEQFSLGFIASVPGSESDGAIADVVPGTPAAQAGLAPGMRLVAVNGRRWTPEILRDAIRAAKGGTEPIELLLQDNDYFQTCRVNYHGGERYPHLERVTSKLDVLTEIAKAKAPPVPKD